MTVPDRICGLEVRHSVDRNGRVSHLVVPNGEDLGGGSWTIYEPVLGSVVYTAHCSTYQRGRTVDGTKEACIAAVEASIRSVAEECRAFADKVLGER